MTNENDEYNNLFINIAKDVQEKIQDFINYHLKASFKENNIKLVKIHG